MATPTPIAPIYEQVYWQAKEEVSSVQMIKAMQIFSHELETLPGFIEETLYQTGDQDWLAVYYWQTEQDAHNSNTVVANKPSFQQLLSLIEPESVRIEVYQPVQKTSGS